MSTNQNIKETDQSLTDLGIHISDLSSQPQTFKGIAKKLMQLSHAAESAEQATSEAPVATGVDEQIAKIKESIPKWAFAGGKPGDGRVATPAQEEEASATLDELEDFINSAPSMESLMDIQFAIEQGNIMMQHQFYKLDKLEDYEYNLLTSRMTSQADHEGLSLLGVGIESSLPHVSMFTQTPSPVNYGAMKSALEAKKEGLSKILSVVGGTVLKLVFVVLAQLFIVHLFRLLDYMVRRGEGLFKKAQNRKNSNKKVNVKQLDGEVRRRRSTKAKTPVKESNVSEHLDLTKYTVEEISLAKLYEDSAKSQLKASNLDDLYKAATPNNLSNLTALWTTLQDVLHSVQASIVTTTKEVDTLSMLAPTDEAVVDPSKLESSLLTVNALNNNFQKYDDIKTDIPTGIEILTNLSKIFKKGDVDKFDREVKKCKEDLVRLDAGLKAKATDAKMTPELSAHLARRIYLLRVASDYLTKNINLQVRFQKLALGHVAIFEKMDKEADELLDIIDKMNLGDNNAA